MSDQTYRPVELECWHKLWFLPSQMPNVGEWLWCRSCDAYQRAGHEDVRLGRVIEDEFWSEPDGKTTYKGGCITEGCNYKVTKARNWYRLRDTIHRHVMRAHTRFGPTLEIQLVNHPKGAPPPF